MDVGTVGCEGVDSVDVRVVGTAEVVKGPGDGIQYFLDTVLCEHESPRDQNFVGGSDGHQPAIAADQAARPIGPTAQVVVPAAPYCKHKR